MPVITVALFALAGVVLAVAIVIQQMAGGDGDDGTSPADQVSANATNTVLAAAATATASGGAATTPGAGTPTTSRTPGAGTPAANTPATGSTPGTSVKTHTVQAGEFCGTIADAAGISLDDFFALNPSISRDCSNLGIGQVVNIAR